jgi:hypothetical protein
MLSAQASQASLKRIYELERQANSTARAAPCHKCHHFGHANAEYLNPGHRDASGGDPFRTDCGL